ncbi:hypothetical protein [Arthrobacter sp. YN]|uniref:hypothetical protein n=1 Tax=Arthrobacter sp. YN TaxID=2020486 RepID=UPI000B606204|nr:hypothetical protein [Arthrobacter sp. YN]ASN20717.1 hypothetical protein CGK93_14270 [Arthrobacter sp. YN]
MPQRYDHAATEFESKVSGFLAMMDLSGRTTGSLMKRRLKRERPSDWEAVGNDLRAVMPANDKKTPTR